MKAPKQPKKVDFPNQNNLRVKRSNKTTNGAQRSLCTTVSNETVPVQKEPSRLGQTTFPIEAKFTVCSRETNEVSAASLIDSGTKVSSKIKLQLFPGDENTRIGLEKDGFCPYLELTISPQKKISSVLKHIMTKWGRSSIAIGEPKLLSCNNDKVQVQLTSQKVWTLADSTVHAVDVFEALGQPFIFRLWYCWFPKCQSYPSASAAIPAAVYSHHEACDNSTDHYENIYATEKETKEMEVFNMTNVPKVSAPSEDNLLSAPNYHVDKDIKADCDVDKNLLLWYDSCTNISIGGLLSEASLQGKFNSKPDACMLMPKQGTSGMNALAASNVPSSLHMSSSILDAEDTCSSFSFRKLLSSGNDAPATEDIISTKSRTSCSTQVEAAQEAETDLILCSEVYNDDRSLGLRSIKWLIAVKPDLFSGEPESLPMALLCKYRLGLFAFVSMCVLLSAIRLAKGSRQQIADGIIIIIINAYVIKGGFMCGITADLKSVGGAVMDLEKADHHKAGHNAFISHPEESPGDGEGNLEWMDYSSTRKKTPIHN
ncbi:unnamed protein product [Rhodiola kirilowii]